MARYLYRPNDPRADEFGMVSAEEALPKSVNSAAYVISDIMEPTRHMADNKYYDSKAEFRRVTKVHGCIEVGNELATMLKPRKPVPLSREQRRNEIRKVISQLR